MIFIEQYGTTYMRTGFCKEVFGAPENIFNRVAPQSCLLIVF